MHPDVKPILITFWSVCRFRNSIGIRNILYYAPQPLGLTTRSRGKDNHDTETWTSIEPGLIRPGEVMSRVTASCRLSQK